MKHTKADIERALHKACHATVSMCCREYRKGTYTGPCVCSPEKCEQFQFNNFLSIAKAEGKAKRKV